MSETRELVRAAATLRANAKPFLLATVVEVKGSSYRRPGARMLFTEDRWLAGSVSGGCLEGDLLRKGAWQTRENEATLLRYDSTTDEESHGPFGLGCEGEVEVLVERVTAGHPLDPLAFAERCLAGQQRGVIATVFRSLRAELRPGARLVLQAGGAYRAAELGALQSTILADAQTVLAEGRTQSRSYDGVDVLFDVVIPPARLFLFGTGFDAVPVMQLAKTVGLEVIVCDTQEHVSTRERFLGADEVLVESAAGLASRIDGSDRAMAVVMGHNYPKDRAMLGMCWGTRARYIGMLGPSRRTARMMTELDLPADERIHSPVGLELGAESPREIALEIVAEVQAVLSGAAQPAHRPVLAIPAPSVSAERREA
jgi:xanthine dehydrogenase accessory factor